MNPVEQIKIRLRLKIAKWPYGIVSVLAAIAAFGTYTAMYAFRKGFAAATFSGQEYLHFDYKVCLVTASDVSRNRPNPDMITFAMQRFNIPDGGSVIKVGDSAIDIEEGQNAGCRYNIGITTGAHTAEQLQAANPDAVIDDLMEVLMFIKQN